MSKLIFAAGGCSPCERDALETLHPTTLQELSDELEHLMKAEGAGVAPD